MSSRIPRVFVEQSLAHPGQSLSLPKEAANYLTRTLRLKPGYQIVVFDGAGYEYFANIRSVTRTQVSLDLERRTPALAESALQLCLVQCLAKADAMDWILRKCTELGVREIRPAISAHSVVNLSPERAKKKKHHWDSVVQAACNQSGRHFLPQVMLPAPLEVALGSVSEVPTKWLLDPGRGNPIDLAPPKAPAAVAVAVGPEGGFSEAESAQASRLGWELVKLGPRTLRTETAAVTICALLQTAWGDMGPNRETKGPG